MIDEKHNWTQAKRTTILRDFGVCCVDRGAQGAPRFDVNSLHSYVRKSVVDSALLFLVNLEPHGVSSTLVRNAFSKAIRDEGVEAFKREFVKLLASETNISVKDASVIVTEPVLQYVWNKRLFIDDL